ncbi:TM2 domain-containing protein [Joostella atrarenae]|uniref:TM2 domain-containing protein n=1 Tax=Joostella atrarenae TaxID=679257 RepID=A0ABS9J590_9FLAO|nr:TM2 domain-containing protein [Joostella atrarenae]MCF8715498.1 TM2 domain-containing protein [Joostella atrarenae]
MNDNEKNFEDKAKDFSEEAKKTANEFKEGAREAQTSFETQNNKKVMAGVLGIVLGALGIHKFVLGYQKEGLIMLLGSILTCGILAPVMSIIGLIEGIIYLTKSDEEFFQTYQIGKKTWF